jgi:hypothetical protein
MWSLTWLKMNLYSVYAPILVVNVQRMSRSLLVMEKPIVARSVLTGADAITRDAVVSSVVNLTRQPILGSDSTVSKIEVRKCNTNSVTVSPFDQCSNTFARLEGWFPALANSPYEARSLTFPAI